MRSKNESAPVAEDGSEDGGDRTSPSKGLENLPCASHANLTPSGKSAGCWPPTANWVASFPLVSRRPVQTRFYLDSILFTAACRYSPGREFLSDAPFLDLVLHAVQTGKLRMREWVELTLEIVFPFFQAARHMPETIKDFTK